MTQAGRGEGSRGGPSLCTEMPAVSELLGLGRKPSVMPGAHRAPEPPGEEGGLLWKLSGRCLGKYLVWTQ